MEQNLLDAVIKAKAGDQTAFNYIYENTYRKEYYVALKYMKNDQDAQDVLQDAYIKAMNSISTLENPEGFSCWLSTIVSNTAMNALKKKQPMLFSDISSENEEGEEFEFQIEDEREINNPEVAYTKQETSEMVKILLDGLSEEQKMAVIMFHFEGNSLNEIAEAMDCNLNTAKSRLNLGRKKLKDSCEELERKGYKLYGATPVALLIMLLGMEFKNTLFKAIAFSGVAASASAVEAANVTKGMAVLEHGALDQTEAAGTKSAITRKTIKKGVKKTAKVANKAGMSIGAKIGITLASLAVIGVAVFLITNPKDEEKEDYKKVTAHSEDDKEEAKNQEADLRDDDKDNRNEDDNTESVNAGDEIEEVEVDPEIAERSLAFYNMLVSDDGYMLLKEQDENFHGFNTELYYSNIHLVDFNGDGKKLVVFVDEPNHLVKVYDFVNGEVCQVLEKDYTNSEHNYTVEAMVQSRVVIRTREDGTSSLIISDPDGAGSITEYTYENGSLVETELLAEDHNNLDYTDFDFSDNGNALVEYVANHGAYATGATYYEIDSFRKESINKARYDEILADLATKAGIDTSDVWKKVYGLRLNQIQEISNQNATIGGQAAESYYEYALCDITGDGIPELFGIFHGWDGGTNFVMTCSLYGTFDYITLARGMDMSSGYNYINADNGYIHTELYDLDIFTMEDALTYDRVYVTQSGYFVMVGNYEQYYKRMDDELYENWFWSDFSKDDAVLKYAGTVSSEEYESMAGSYAGSQTLNTAFEYVDTIDEITSLIENY